MKSRNHQRIFNVVNGLLDWLILEFSYLFSVYLRQGILLGRYDLSILNEPEYIYLSLVYSTVMLVVFAVPMAVICLYPVVLSAYGNVYLPAAYGAIVGFFFLGMALLAIGMYISSVTESQAVAAGLCFVVMLVNYFLSDLAGFASSTAYSSLAALALTALIACGIVYLMTKNGFVSLILAAVLEAGLIGGYLWDSSRFEGLFPQIISQLSLFARFYTIVNGVFDVTAIVYYLSVTGFFLFLSVQSLEKRRWSE